MSLMYESAARQPDQEPACQIGDPGMPPGHEGHHEHVRWGEGRCSCGYPLWTGCIAVIGDGSELQSRPKVSCSVCGQPDVEWAGNTLSD